MPVTSLLRTIVDCARDDLSPDLLRQAVAQTLTRGIVFRDSILDAVASVPALAGVLKS